MIFSFALANPAAAQQLPQTSISYSAEPDGLVSVNADGRLVVLPQTSVGAVTVTIRGIEMSLVGGQYVRTGYAGMTVLTLTFLSSCNVKDGCDIFGLPSAADDFRTRVNAFRAMSLPTLSMYIAAGGDMNELAGTQSNSFLLYYVLRDIPHDSPRVSLMLAAGADVNAKGPDNLSMLHFAVTELSQPTRLSNFLNIEGVSVNAVNGSGQTPLDFLAVIVGDAPPLLPLYAPHAISLRAKGGVCLLASSKTASPAICGTE